jgi:plastocyanin
MKNTIIIIVVLIVVGLGAYYLVSQNSNNSQTGTSNIYTPTNSGTDATMMPAPQPVPSSTAPAPATSSSSVTVNIKGFAFTPSTTTIKQGTKVTWVNNDSVAHTVTSDSGNLLNSGTIAPGKSFSFTFTNPGTTSYHCTIHPMMKGTVVVE